MIKLDKYRANELEQLAFRRFCERLEDAELKVLQASASSEILVVPSENGSRAAVRAEFLRWLATDSECAPHIDALGIRVYCATVQGKLELEECVVSRALDFRLCEFQAEINLKRASTQGVYFFNSTLNRGIAADRITIHGSLLLRRIESFGEVCLSGAQIGGDLDCSGAHFIVSESALNADGAKIEGDLHFSILEEQTPRRFESDGAISLVGAEISGQLMASGAKLSAKEVALEASGLTVGDVFLRTESGPDFECFGDVRFVGAYLQGDLDCSGAKLRYRSRYAFLCLQFDAKNLLLRWPKKWLAWLEENPIRILSSIAIALFVGTCVFIWGGNKGAMTEVVRFQPASVYSYFDERQQPGSVPVFSGGQSRRVSSIYPKFQPFVYALENSVPLVKLGMDEKWVPNAAPQFCWPWFPRIPWLYFISTYGILNFTRWFLIVWGWVQATILAAAVVDRFKK